MKFDNNFLIVLIKIHITLLQLKLVNKPLIIPVMPLLREIFKVNIKSVIGSDYYIYAFFFRSAKQKNYGYSKFQGKRSPFRKCSSFR